MKARYNKKLKICLECDILQYHYNKSPRCVDCNLKLKESKKWNIQ